MATYPYEALGIPEAHRHALQEGAPKKIKLAVAKALVPSIPPRVYLAIWYCQLGDPDAEVADAARRSLTDGLTEDQVRGAIGNLTHPKVLEVLAEFRRVYDQQLMADILRIPHTNDRTGHLIAEVAVGELFEKIVRNQERLLITPTIYLYLATNENADQELLRRASDYLRLNRALPEGVDPDGTVTIEVPPVLGFEKAKRSGPSAAELEQKRLEAEVEAALMGLPSPTTNEHVAEKFELDMFDLGDVEKGGLGGFTFDFADERSDFGFDLTRDPGDGASREEVVEARQNMKQKIALMTPGKKIKLAYLGNKEARSVLVRDRNKAVASAVVKSGRLTDTEVLSIAGNKNLDGEVIRELTRNKEYMRKYQVKVALCNNPKTPVSSAIGFVNQLQRRDLEMLARNKNVGGAVTQLARRKVIELKRNKG